MRTKILLSIVALLGSCPAWCQVEPSASGGSGSTDDDSAMSFTPAVSGAFYPASVGATERSNVLSVGVATTVGYDDNVLVGETTKPVSAESYNIVPTIGVAQTTARTRASLTYVPGFTFYEPVTELNRVTQNAVADFSYRLTPRATLSAQEMFQQNSTVFSQPYLFAGAGMSGSAEASSPILLVPYAGQVMDTTSGHFGYQFSRSSMIGGSGYYSLFHFSDVGQTVGLYNSNSGGGSAFYTRRLTRSQYLGAEYRYSVAVTNPVASTIKSQFGSVIYTVYLERTLSLSLTGGPEYSTISTPGSAPTNTWAPSGTATLGWQKSRANVVLSYARAVTTGWGLVGAYTTDTASTLLSWQFTRKWIGSLSGDYANTKNAAPNIPAATQIGHMIFGRASVEYLLGEHMTAAAEYNRFHENFAGIAFVRNNPNDDRVTISLSYRLSRPLGR